MLMEEVTGAAAAAAWALCKQTAQSQETRRQQGPEAAGTQGSTSSVLPSPYSSVTHNFALSFFKMLQRTVATGSPEILREDAAESWVGSLSNLDRNPHSTNNSLWTPNL